MGMKGYMCVTGSGWVDRVQGEIGDCRQCFIMKGYTVISEVMIGFHSILASCFSLLIISHTCFTPGNFSSTRDPYETQQIYAWEV